MTVEELAAELGIPAETLAAKPDVVKKWNSTFATTESNATQKLADAQKQLTDAQNLQRVIDENIRTAGLTETNMAQLQANNAALTAALESVKKAGFTGITIPDLPKPGTSTVDPMDTLKNTIVQGFTNIGQTLNEMNRYQRVFGAPLPEDPQTIADRAAAARLSVHDYVEQTYKVSAKETELATASRQKEMDAYAETKINAYKEAHPSTAGHPELNGGLPSNYPTMPKPREATSVREFASLPARQKIADAMQRATKDVSARNAA